MTPDVRSLDHFVIAVHDAERAGQTYERLGFQVLPLMRHIELGCCNRVMQLHGTYLELLGDVPQSVAAIRDRMLPRFDCGEGLTIVSLTSHGLEQDRARLHRLRLDTGPVLSARRTVRMPDGTSDETDSRCFYVWRHGRLYTTLFFSEHHKPHTIWIPEYQSHENTARRVTSLTYLSTEPLAEIDYVATLLGTVPVASEPDCVTFETARKERIEFLSPGLLAYDLGAACAPVCPSQPAYGVALEIAVGDLDRCHRVVTRNGVQAELRADRVRVPAHEAHGVVLDFIEDVE